MVDEESFRLKLLQKDDVEIYGFKVKQYTIKEISRLGVNKFNAIRNFVWLDVNTLDKEFRKSIDESMNNILDFLKETYRFNKYDKTYSMFDLVCYEPNLNTMFIRFMSTFTKHSIISVEHNPIVDAMVIMYDDTHSKIINRYEYNDLIDMFTIVNFAVGHGDDNILMDVKKGKGVEEYEAEVDKLLNEFGFKKEKPNITFYSILEWLVNDGSGYTHENIGYKTIYQVMSSYSRKNHIEYCKAINTTRCNGMLGKMDKKDLEKATLSFELYR